MKLCCVERTYVCQFNKPKNRKMLEDYKKRKDGSGAELARYYTDVVNALRGTPAWGVSGVNKMINELTTKVRATLNQEKKGKTSAWAHAGKLLADVKWFGVQDANPYYRGKYKLDPVLTEEELSRLAEMV